MSERIKAFVATHLNDDVNRLLLDAKKYPQIDIKEAVKQIKARRIIKEKLPEWFAREDLLFPDHLPLEQCSSESTARWKAQWVQGETMADLTGGLGIDCYFLSQRFEKAIYVERQEELCTLAKHNFASLGRTIEVVHADSLDYLSMMPSVDLIFIDPARRSKDGKKTVLLEDCEPNLSAIKDALLAKAPQVFIKLSPMLDLTAALKALPETKKAIILSVKNECKELLLLMERGFVGEAEVLCVNLSTDGSEQSYHFKLSEEKEAPVIYTHQMERYLYEPHASLMKAGAFRSLSASFGLKKLHSNTHLYTSDDCHPDFPGRVFEIENVFSLNKKEIKQALQGVQQANVAVRNFPLTAQDLQKKLGLKDGGSIYLFGVTVGKERRLLLTHKIES